MNAFVNVPKQDMENKKHLMQGLSFDGYFGDPFMD